MPGEQEKQVRVQGTATFERRGLAAQGGRTAKANQKAKGKCQKAKVKGHRAIFDFRLPIFDL